MYVDLNTLINLNLKVLTLPENLYQHDKYWQLEERFKGEETNVPAWCASNQWIPESL